MLPDEANVPVKLIKGKTYSMIYHKEILKFSYDAEKPTPVPGIVAKMLMTTGRFKIYKKESANET